MTKELLENLLIEFDEMGYEPTILCDTQKEVESFRNRLKQVLDYLKSLDNANPSEALDKFDYIENDIKFAYDDDYVSYDYTDDVEYIKQYLLKAQEQEKVLSIIKERHIDILSLEECIEREKMGNVANALEYYNENYAFNRSCELTQEEFELLKSYLKIYGG